MKDMDGVEVVGTLNTQAWYSTLGAIFSRKYGKEIVGTVTQPKEEGQEKEKASA